MRGMEPGNGEQARADAGRLTRSGSHGSGPGSRPAVKADLPSVCRQEGIPDAAEHLASSVNSRPGACGMKGLSFTWPPFHDGGSW